ncbi:MAG: ABC transporter ATP-binding protein [Candidatus Aminicenantes bacterium]|nr:ABC transporter ATP-binding protein [Candidatus Aminicenantes bacterium]
METALKTENLHKTFKLGFIPKKKAVLKGISFSVIPGEIFGYLGPNGAGKTTTLKCVTGLIFPDKGNIDIFGRPHLSLEAKEKIGFLPENPYFYDYLTAREFLRFCSQLFPKKTKIKSPRILELLSLVGLKEVADLPLRKFSKGMLQRAGFAQALIHDPEMVILDEPLGGLDPIGRKELRDIIVRLKEEGKTVLLSSHILQDIEMICDRVAIILNGEIINQGSLQDLISQKVLFTEIVLSGVEPQELTAFGEPLSTFGGRTLLKIFEEDKIDNVLRLIHSREAKVHSLVPRTETLEDLFVGIVKNT